MAQALGPCGVRMPPLNWAARVRTIGRLSCRTRFPHAQISSSHVLPVSQRALKDISLSVRVSYDEYNSPISIMNMADRALVALDGAFGEAWVRRRRGGLENQRPLEVA